MYSFVICQSREGESKIFEWDRPFVASFPCPCCTGIYCMSDTNNLDHIFPDGGPRDFRPTLGRLMEISFEMITAGHPRRRIAEILEAISLKLNRPFSSRMLILPSGVDAAFFRMKLLETMDERLLNKFLPFRLFQILNLPREYDLD